MLRGRHTTISTHLQHFLSYIGKDTKLKELERTDCENCTKVHGFMPFGKLIDRMADWHSEVWLKWFVTIFQQICKQQKNVLGI